jgi:hypothetical protein
MAVFLIYEDFFTEMPHPPHYLCPIGRPLRSTKHLLKTMGFPIRQAGSWTTLMKIHQAATNSCRHVMDISRLEWMGAARCALIHGSQPPP